MESDQPKINIDCPRGSGKHLRRRVIVPKHAEFRVLDTSDRHMSKQRQQVTWSTTRVLPDQPRWVSSCRAERHDGISAKPNGVPSDDALEITEGDGSPTIRFGLTQVVDNGF